MNCCLHVLVYSQSNYWRGSRARALFRWDSSNSIAELARRTKVFVPISQPCTDFLELNFLDCLYRFATYWWINRINRINQLHKEVRLKEPDTKMPWLEREDCFGYTAGTCSIYVDETHKHRNASRQDAGGRAWGKRNSGGLARSRNGFLSRLLYLQWIGCTGFYNILYHQR
jgi:hypothetical protein